MLRLAAARFEPQRAYRESEVNELLRAWLETFCAPYGIDHVTMRRCLIDTRYLLRDTSGAEYRLNALKAGEPVSVEPAALLAEIQEERAARKRRHGVL